MSACDSCTTYVTPEFAWLESRMGLHQEFQELNLNGVKYRLLIKELGERWEVSGARNGKPLFAPVRFASEEEAKHAAHCIAHADAGIDHRCPGACVPWRLVG